MCHFVLGAAGHHFAKHFGEEHRLEDPWLNKFMRKSEVTHTRSKTRKITHRTLCSKMLTLKIRQKTNINIKSIFLMQEKLTNPKHDRPKFIIRSNREVVGCAYVGIEGADQDDPEQ